MGGIVARLGFHNNRCDLNKILAFISISSPHILPPVSWDSYVIDCYKKLKHHNNYKFNVFGIIGGWKDNIIYPPYMVVDKFVKPKYGLTITTSHVNNFLTSLSINYLYRSS